MKNDIDTYGKSETLANTLRPHFKRMCAEVEALRMAANDCHENLAHAGWRIVPGREQEYRTLSEMYDRARRFLDPVERAFNQIDPRFGASVLGTSAIGSNR